MINNILLEDAEKLLLSKVEPVDIEMVNILNLLGRTLGQDIYANNNIPPFDRSPLDGYAIKSQETICASYDKPAKFKVIGTVAAGDVFTGEVISGCAVKIMTGAPLPNGFDVVVRKEDTDNGQEYVEVYTPLKPYSNFACKGEDVKIGEKLLSKGDRVNCSIIGMLAALGLYESPVYKMPRVAILSTGTELQELGRTLTPGKIYNSNLYSIAASVSEIGGQPIFLDTAKDDLDEIITKIQLGLKEADIVVTTGGASVGDYDLIGQAFEKIGAKLLFWRVSMKPGTPVLAAQKDGKLLIGLSGNPAAALISFELLVRPLILKMAGSLNLKRPTIKGTLIDDFNKTSTQRRFLRVSVQRKNNIYEISLSGKQNPGVLKSMLYCNGLVDIPSNCALKKGQEIDVILLMDGVN
ncbi:MAG: molybdopterin molybdotransferase MoeA [Clostridium sp.]